MLHKKDNFQITMGPNMGKFKWNPTRGNSEATKNSDTFRNYSSMWIRPRSSSMSHLTSDDIFYADRAALQLALPPLFLQMVEAEGISNNELPRWLSVLTPFSQSPLNTLSKNREDRNLGLHLKRLDGAGKGWTNNKINWQKGRSYGNGGIKFGRKCCWDLTFSLVRCSYQVFNIVCLRHGP